MSRRMVSANNKKIADRIIKEIEIFPAERDDAPIQKKWEYTNAFQMSPRRKVHSVVSVRYE